MCSSRPYRPHFKRYQPMILFFSCEQFFDLNLVLVRFSLGLDYEYIPVNLLKGDQSDSGA